MRRLIILFVFTVLLGSGLGCATVQDLDQIQNSIDAALVDLASADDLTPGEVETRLRQLGDELGAVTDHVQERAEATLSNLGGLGGAGGAVIATVAALFLNWRRDERRRQRGEPTGITSAG